MKIQYSKQAEKFLQKQPPNVSFRIRQAIRQLPSGDVKKLQGRNGYRLRVGNFRIIFDRDGNIILVIEIDNRGQIYK